MARRPRLCRSGRPLPVSARTGQQPDGLRRWAHARWIPGRPCCMGGLHPAVGGGHDGRSPMARARLRGLSATGVLHGLKLVAVAIVAQAVMGMAQTLCPDRPRATIAVLSLILTALAPAAWAQIAVILPAPLAGVVPLSAAPGRTLVVGAAEASVSRRMGIVFAGLYVALLALSFAPMGAGARPSPRRSTVRGRWCSAADTSFCRCFALRWSIRVGSPTAPSWLATAPRRPFRGRYSPSRPISAQSPALHPEALSGRRWRWSQFLRPNFCC